MKFWMKKGLVCLYTGEKDRSRMTEVGRSKKSEAITHGTLNSEFLNLKLVTLNMNS